jgi:uncharacterized protein
MQSKVYYYKNPKHQEVDFVVQQNLKITTLIQVCSSVSDPKVKEREVRSLLNAGTDLNCKRLIVLTNSYEKTEKHTWFGNTGEIEFIPLWKWLLNSRKNIEY